jgi:8-oxo-dGTP pyrophosphatase MutT (NUDIX family)
VEQRLRQVLANREVRQTRDESRQLSAVLVPIYYKQGDYYLVFTKRTERVKEHKGQISFPGGAYQEGDETLLNTALRECAEEIGLVADKVEILGALDDTLTHTSNYIISPFVALIPWPYEFRVNTDEIEEIIEVPISALIDKNCVREESEIIGGEAVSYFSYHYQGRVIWGATAGILRKFLDIVTQARDDR